MSKPRDIGADHSKDQLDPNVFDVRQVVAQLNELSELLFEEPEDEVEAGGYDALGVEADLVEDAHGVGLSGAGLSVDEVAAVIAVEDVENEGQCTLLEDLGLEGLLAEDLRELEVSLAPLRVIMKCDPLGLDDLHAAPQSIYVLLYQRCFY